MPHSVTSDQGLHYLLPQFLVLLGQFKISHFFQPKCIDTFLTSPQKHGTCRDHASNAVLQLGFEGRGVPGRALFVRSYKNEGTMCHVMCLVSSHVTKYKPCVM